MPEIILEQEEHALSLDDNTLFILLALEYSDNNQMTIKGGLQAVYTPNVNYHNTLIKTLSKSDNINEYAAAGLAWIEKTFDIITETNDEELTLQLRDKNKLKDYLQTYLKDFTIDRTFYFTEKQHRDLFYKFIQINAGVDGNATIDDIINYEGKHFTYKILKDEESQLKYKMFHYIGYLINKKTLCAQPNSFECEYPDIDKKYKPSIRLKFTSTDKAKELFLDKLDETTRREYLHQQKATIPIAQSSKWQIFDLLHDNIYHIPTKTKFTLKESFTDLLKWAIEKGNGEVVTSDDYLRFRNNKKEKGKKIKLQTVKGYISELNGVCEEKVGDERGILIAHNTGNSYTVNV